jgi:hypothetical protein
MTLREALSELLDRGNSGPPTARALIDHFSPRAKKVAVAGPQLTRAPWARRVGGADDTFLDLDGDLAGLQIWEDSRGWGAYVELAVRKGTLADVEAVAGATTPMPRAPGAFNAGEKVAVYVQRGGRTIRVFAELVKRGPDVAVVTLHFQRS